VCCAAAHACLEVLVDDGVVKDVEQKGALLELLIQHNKIKQIRRAGLMFAIEMENEEIVFQVVKKCQEKGLLSFWFLSCPESFRIAPPLIVTTKEIQQAAKIIVESINECS
ncbi:MAG: aminotransferase class III-fold pyridoxal phosphate-dependent enzyme, partial [Bacteroidia bacterium]